MPRAVIPAVRLLCDACLRQGARNIYRLPFRPEINHGNVRACSYCPTPGCCESFGCAGYCLSANKFNVFRNNRGFNNVAPMNNQN
ncbi:Gonadotropin beta subunit [Echinococcus multilocularis]|uniref:Gonadotropin beta subunit n=1 Tax=Echinococcus multilocularis TaxID=6211 RepID=A0A068YNM2_ECHMU|nr:Gonadotropin beta subunit [Echinococcus multilocularis]